MVDVGGLSDRAFTMEAFDQDGAAEMGLARCSA